jgi:hypothetical protein
MDLKPKNLPELNSKKKLGNNLCHIHMKGN